MNGQILKQLWRHALERETLGRTLVDLKCREFSLEGKGIDLGAKNPNASYQAFFQKSVDTDIIFTDLYSNAPSVLKIDLEKAIPIDDASKDFALLFNVLEHLYEYKTCVREISRILRPGGKIYGCVPFLHKVHPDPQDYYRYTDTALQRIFSVNGFSQVDIIPLGFGPFSAGFSMFDRLPRIGVLIFLLRLLAISLDKTCNAITKGHRAVRPENFPLSYFFVGTK